MVPRKLYAVEPGPFGPERRLDESRLERLNLLGHSGPGVGS